MSAALLIQAWGDTMFATALLVLGVLIVRKPFARRFGPGLTYALWAIPALRLILPPLPLADPAEVSTLSSPVPADVMLIDVAETVRTVGTPAMAPATGWSLADALPLLFALWLAGALAVLGRALLAHRRFKADVLAHGVDLEPLGKIRLVMTDAIDGPVAFGLFRRYVAVPRDFFARYVADERALAIDHEVSHHRHGDLWANAAALLLLATQWFNPFAWRAFRAFRFDQEAACDARVLTMAEAEGERRTRTASYATAITKSAVGPRLALAAPMASRDNLQERLMMLMQKDISRTRGVVGRLLVGSAALGVLAATATLVPAATATASVRTGDFPAPPEPPAHPEVIDAPHSTMILMSEDNRDGAEKRGAPREVTRIVVRDGGQGDGDTRQVRRFEFSGSGDLSRDDILATLNEQGITGARADAIADKLEAKRREGFRTAMVSIPSLPPVPPLPPLPPARWTSGDGKATAIARCGDDQRPMPIVDRDDREGRQHSRVLLVRCGDGPDLSGQVDALKKVRERFMQGETSGHLSSDMRAKVVADMDRAIADLERDDK